MPPSYTPPSLSPSLPPCFPTCLSVCLSGCRRAAAAPFFPLSHLFLRAITQRTSPFFLPLSRHTRLSTNPAGNVQSRPSDGCHAARVAKGQRLYIHTASQPFGVEQSCHVSLAYTHTYTHTHTYTPLLYHFVKGRRQLPQKGSPHLTEGFPLQIHAERGHPLCCSDRHPDFTYPPPACAGVYVQYRRCIWKPTRRVPVLSVLPPSRVFFVSSEQLV